MEVLKLGHSAFFCRHGVSGTSSSALAARWPAAQGVMVATFSTSGGGPALGSTP